MRWCVQRSLPARADVRQKMGSIEAGFDGDWLRKRLNVDVKQYLRSKAVAHPKKVVFPETGEERILRAARESLDIGIAHPILAGKPEIYRPIRPRTMVYAAIIASVGALMLYALMTRKLLDVNVLHDRNPVAIRLADGSVRNAYTVRLLNKRAFDQTVAIDVDGVASPTLHVVGVDSVTVDRPEIVVGRDSTTELRVLVTAQSNASLPASTPVRFIVTDIGTGEVASTMDNFVIP